jgi:lipoyl synthase
VSEHWRVLERRYGDHHAAGGHVHSRVHVLRGQDRCETAPARPVRALQGTRQDFASVFVEFRGRVSSHVSLYVNDCPCSKTAEAVAEWGVDYIVLTSVDRDDIPDGGAQHFAHTVELLKHKKPNLLVECLVSDFLGMKDSVGTLARSGLDVYAHNVETVERLQRFVRDPRATYRQSLSTLEHAKAVNPALYTKTSLMLGLGETDDEVVQTMKDLRAIGVDVVTFGQYLRPTEKHLAVVEYVTPDKFAMFQRIGEELGFKYVASGPMVRSSYKAGEFYLEHMIKKERSEAQSTV